MKKHSSQIPVTIKRIIVQSMDAVKTVKEIPWWECLKKSPRVNNAI